MENINELLYMIHMNDEYALKELIKNLNSGYEAEIARMIKSFPAFSGFKGEMKQEMCSTLYIAIESYRFDVDCSFRTYAMVIARRRLYRMICVLNHQFLAGLNRTASLDAQTRLKTEYSALIASRDVLSSPEYVLNLREANERLKDAVNHMPEKDRRIYDTWQAGYKYKSGSERLGISCKQYESNLLKVKRIVHQAVMA